MTRHELLHKLWTKAVGTDDYVKAEWKVLEKLLLFDSFGNYIGGQSVPFTEEDQ